METKPEETRRGNGSRDEREGGEARGCATLRAGQGWAGQGRGGGTWRRTGWHRRWFALHNLRIFMAACVRASDRAGGPSSGGELA